MELITQYSRAYRRAYERSISEQKFENHQHYPQDFIKGQSFNLRKIHEENHSYQQENAMRYEDCDRASDLRIDKNGHSLNNSIARDERHQNGNCITIKQELMHQPIPSSSPHPPPIRRYFCIFCKLDFSSADDFLEHLELHPNGSFVLVKRDMPPSDMPIISSSPQIQRPSTPKIIIQHPRSLYNNNNNNNNNNDINEDLRINSKFEKHEEHTEVTKVAAAAAKEQEEIEDYEEDLPIIPEVLKNQIKIEPISDDEEEEVEENHISNNNHNTFNQTNNAPQYNNNNNNNNNNLAATLETSESGDVDPNQQLLVLSNPRIGDGPGEYLCNVCQAKFVYKNNLKSHLKRHLGIYPYVCFCGKRYQFKCKLNKHIEQAHAKIKNFKCPVPTCPKKYFTRNDLAFHISVTHQERQEIPCTICQKVFNSQKSLQIHCRKYHRNQES